MANFLNLTGKTFLIFGVANRKSVAYFIAKTLEEEGATVLYSVRSEKRKESLQKLLGNKPVYICDVEFPEQIKALAAQISAQHPSLDGIVHSIAFANYSEGLKPFHETNRKDYLQATVISSFSLIEIANAFKPYLNKHASVVAISISSQVTAENYGYMSPIKASLDSSVRYLAKSFSKDTQVRFNTVNAGPLKTSASAGIPGYMDNYIFAEKLTLRKQALTTQEVADTAVYLLSERSSGINAQGIVVNAGMDWNYFDNEVVHAATRLPSSV
ncbi:MAG: enoyl-ACP reductase [Verrucomicrobia bacterium CG_4_10_14_3_um_filter_43_23]|nr:MAG: enoyl-ACP reductase [Verrucomicrobia bacterium CG1_02_43_26]PIP58792.1 MAG: enoyl-ACP reductase [Verrucomicrobia bacterium CG22_combo_CG10-13_8_21_14_all_43_17]PIX58533.1 MAG: enoyl-ACP reductase [Verrucomicrobia bacterium CG_4_10_14_3_um_filter_43_23]PIY61497.1 MAG: enoyl-ACP reductase [Verrucomicrobia bacterium CG_4_10_14_0_8_um_filter_43_34]PJA44797.1 MAG: enoyl-ACP reductase [Verrucomicrobia bacterium CG_4_9_14_3_um_filter_43_20]